jgi:TolB-like protein/cytochrome c-type biogenesis protein CcmH/NrfG
MLGLPDWAPKLVLLFLLIGFVPALIFAWAFELTPEGIKREKEVDRTQSIAPQTGKKLNNAILVLMALAIAYLLFDKFSGSRDSGPEANSIVASAVSSDGEEVNLTLTPQVAKPAVTRQSIAVLPFDNRSPDANDAYFAEGIHDDLLTNLARISALKVISRTSVTQYKGTTKTIPQIAAELGVAHIMEGAVQRAGDSVRINVQLIDAQTDEHLWAEIFDRDLSAQNLFAIQSEISQAIADALKTTLTSEEQQRINTAPTQNLAAYEAYLRGRQLMATRESKKLEQAIDTLREATTLDPRFALAWVGLADSHALLAAYGTLGRVEAIAAMQTATAKALSLDPELGEAHTSLAYLQNWTNEWNKAEVSYRKAIELSPNYAQAYHWYSNALKSFPLRVDEAIALAQKAVELDPNSSIISLNLADSYETKGLYSMAEQQYRKSIQLDPDFVRGYSALAETLTYNISRYPEALRNQRKAIELDPGNIGHYGTLVDIYSDMGNFSHAQAVIERMSEVDSKHEANGYADVTFNAFSGNNAGVREAVNWTLPKL